MAIHGVRLGERTVDYLRPGEHLCLGCRVRGGCDEKDVGCAWRRYKEGPTLVRAWWEATGRAAERVSLRVVGRNYADASTEAVLAMLNSS